MHDKRKIKALIIDDSALMRQVLTAVLHQDPEIDVVGTGGASRNVAISSGSCTFWPLTIS